MRYDNKSPLRGSPSRSCHRLRTSTAGVDLATSAVLNPTGTYGPLGHGMAALLIGRSSTTLRGLFVLPGIIDTNYESEIKIMAWTPVPPCTVPAGSKIAHLVYFSPQTPNASQVVRGTACLGSTGMPEIYWTPQLTMSQPQLSCTLQTGGTRLAIRGIIDSGADVTVIPASLWPDIWPLMDAHASPSGISGQTSPIQSQLLINIIGPEGRTATIRPFVLPGPVTLWGRTV